MRFLISATLLFIATLASSQEMFNQPVRLSSGDSATINVSEVRVAYEQADGSSKLAYDYPNSTILLRTDFDDLVSNSCGNLVILPILQPSGFQDVALNPAWVYRVYRSSGKTKIQIRQTNQVFETSLSFAAASALLGNCGASSAIDIDSVTVESDTICFYYSDATSDCFALSDTTTTRNWYTANSSTTDSLRFARIIKSAIWLGMDTTGLIRHQVGTLDGSRSTVYQDSVTLMKFGADATNYISIKRDETNIVQSGDGLGSVNVKSDIVNWSSTFAASVHQHNYLAASNYFRFDSSQKFMAGYFPNFPASTWGRGLFYDPSTSTGIRLLNKDGGNTTTAKLELDPQNLSLGSTHTTSSSALTTFTVSQSALALLTSSRTSSTFGVLRWFQSTDVNEEVVGFQQAGATTKPTVSVYLGQGYSGSQYGQYGSRAFSIESQLTSGPYPWWRIDLPDTATDSTGNGILAYNKWRLSNSTPSATNGVMSFHRWTGDGTDTDPGFITMSSLADSISGYSAPSENIYNHDDLLKNGGTTVGLDSGSLKFNLPTTGTVYGLEIIGDAATSSNRFWSTRTAVDSARFQESSGDYLLIVSTDFQLNVSDQTRLVHDSLQIADTGAEAKDKIRSLWGSTPSGWLKRFDGDAAPAGTILKSDGTDWTYADWLSAYSSSTQSTASWTVTNAATNVNAAIVPKGTGAITTDVPDGTSAGGNSRGNYAVDLQQDRNSASQVASGAESVLIGGSRGTASGSRSVSIGGRTNSVTGSGAVSIGGSGSFSVGNTVAATNSAAVGQADTIGASATGGIALGTSIRIDSLGGVGLGGSHILKETYTTAVGFLASGQVYGQTAHANFGFNAGRGTAQASEFVAGRLITGTAETELFLDGNQASPIKRMVLAGTNRNWTGEVKCTGAVVVVGNGTTIVVGDTYSETQTISIKRVGSSTTLLTPTGGLAVTWADTNMGGANFTVTADDTNESLKVTFTPPTLAGSSTQCKAVCAINVVELGY